MLAHVASKGEIQRCEWDEGRDECKPQRRELWQKTPRNRGRGSTTGCHKQWRQCMGARNGLASVSSRVKKCTGGGGGNRGRGSTTSAWAS